MKGVAHMVSIQGKVAIITGAGSGMGKATAQLLAEKGARVVVADINQQAGEETVALIKRSGAQALFVEADVTVPAHVRSLVDEAIASFGGVDILHNNAGTWRMHDRIEDVPDEEWLFIIGLNLNALFFMSKAVFPIMKKRGGGVIINTSSLGAFRPMPTGMSYGAAKAGAVSLTHSLAQHGKQHNIRCNCICPAAVDTPAQLFNAKEARERLRAAGLLDPRDIARLVLRFAGDESLNGVTVSVMLRDGKPRYFKLKDFDFALEPFQGM